MQFYILARLGRRKNKNKNCPKYQTLASLIILYQSSRKGQFYILGLAWKEAGSGLAKPGSS